MTMAACNSLRPKLIPFFSLNTTLTNGNIFCWNENIEIIDSNINKQDGAIESISFPFLIRFIE